MSQFIVHNYMIENYTVLITSLCILQEYSFQITLRQQWNDNRLRYKEKLEADGGPGGADLAGIFLYRC